MKRHYFILMIMMAWLWVTPGFAQQPTNMALTIRPGFFAAVKGDVNKFRAINWTKDGYSGGITKATLEKELNKDTTVSFEGHAIPQNNDMASDLLIKKEDVGYVKLSYDLFRKYYENSGGYFPTYPTPQQTLDKELALDIGHFLFEAGKGSPDDPDLSFAYERNTKDGSKSSTIWGYVRGAAPYDAANLRRKLSPTFIDVEETIDTLTVKGKANVAGFKVKGEQQYVFSQSDKHREEHIVSSTMCSV